MALDIGGFVQRSDWPKMGPLCSVGGICVPEAHLQHLESSLEDLCTRVGFPKGEEFKWFPGRELWMHANLQADGRTGFFLEAGPTR
jgi:hypothetical protein